MFKHHEPVHIDAHVPNTARHFHNQLFWAQESQWPCEFTRSLMIMHFPQDCGESAAELKNPQTLHDSAGFGATSL
jgi:hypothetical protein